MKKKILLIYDRDLMPYTFFRKQEIKLYKIEAKEKEKLKDGKDRANKSQLPRYNKQSV